MKNDEIFQYDNIRYSVIDVSRREVRVGTGVYSETDPNAVNKTYSGTLYIPNFVTYCDIVWRVVEIGQSSFVYCDNIITVRIGFSIEIVKSHAFFRCRYIESVIFETGSRLKTLELQCFYDLYRVTSIEFGGDQLQTINEVAFAFNFILKSLRFPVSVNNIKRTALIGLKQIEKIEFCGKTPIINNVFSRSEESDAITPSSVIIKVTSDYQSSIFGIEDKVVVDDSINCYFPHYIRDFDLQCRTIYNNNVYHISYSLYTVFILIYES